MAGAMALAWLATNPAAACSVCFGDPESPMTRGAVAGVMVLGGVVGFVLVCIASTSLYFVYRGRVVDRRYHNVSGSDESADPRIGPSP
jgi:hypothetical protein